MSQKFPAQASSIGVTLRPVEFKGAKELDATFAALGHQPPEALVVMSDAALYDLRARISSLALTHRMPTIAYVPEFTDAGAFMSAFGGRAEFSGFTVRKNAFSVYGRR